MSALPVPVPQQLNRVQEARRNQGWSLRTAARRLGTDIRTVRQLEDPHADLRLSEVYLWQRALDVPLEDLCLLDDQPVESPVQKRSVMVRVMRTARTIESQELSESQRTNVQNLIAQLLEVMPELAEVVAWPAVGQRRSLEEPSQRDLEPTAIPMGMRGWEDSESRTGKHPTADV
jgi:transcriptional regulator with XRE-family HTH domain